MLAPSSFAGAGWARTAVTNRALTMVGSFMAARTELWYSCVVMIVIVTVKVYRIVRSGWI